MSDHTDETQPTTVSGADAADTPVTPELPSTEPDASFRRRVLLPPVDDEFMTPWMAEDYTPLITRSGAAKLASSGIAPLVAAARGYETVIADNAKEFAASNGVGDGRSKRGSQFLNSFRSDGDVLILPWFSALDIRKDTSVFGRFLPKSIQMRPETPRLNEKGKSVKYEFLVGQETVLDYHPSVTINWLRGVRKTLLAEGLLKGDAALSAQLRYYATDAELAMTEADSNREVAQLRLAAILERIPREERVAILSMAGVGNWRNNQEWSSINVKDQDVFIAFDGDVVKNYNVWSMAKDLFTLIERKHGRPHVLILDDPRIELRHGDVKGYGVDDYFHEMGTFDDLTTMIQGEMPAKPELPLEKRVGEWRVSGDGTAVELCVQPDDGDAYWEIQVHIGGRVKNMEVRRPASEEELRTGAFGKGVRLGAYPSTCAIELSWVDEVTGETKTADVSGPSALLAYPPSEWERKGADIPNSVYLHPDFPPKKGVEWLSAIKRNDAALVEERTTWSTMGWVPVENGHGMAFIAGESIIAESDAVAEAVQAGVDEGNLAGSSRFGVADVYKSENFSSPEDRAGLREDIQTLWDSYIANGPWLTAPISASIISASLRPAVPLATATTVYLSGPPAKGKSWSARHMMSFWQSSPGTWWGPNPLPGSANDTPASIETAVSKTHMWVVDDFAPTPDKRKSETDEAKIADLIRGVFNKLGKRRSNADMTSRAVLTPLALLVLTAENQSSVPSIRERVVSIEFKGLKGDKMDKAETLAHYELTAARVTAALIRMYIQRGMRKSEYAEPGTNPWQDVIAYLEEERETGNLMAKDVLMENGVRAEHTSRPMGIVSDVALGLIGLRDLARLVGLDEIADAIHWGENGQLRYIGEQVALSNRDKAEQAPGQVLLSCLADLLLGGRGHVVNLDDPSQPPIVDDADATRMNTFLGWQASGNDGVMQPKGARLGYYSIVNGAPTVFFIRDDAFNEAQKAYPKRIPYGQASHTSWTDVWNSQLVPQSYTDLAAKPLPGRKEPRGIPSNSMVQFRTGPGKKMRPYGVPIELDRLFSVVEGGDAYDLANESDDE